MGDVSPPHAAQWTRVIMAAIESIDNSLGQSKDDSCEGVHPVPLTARAVEATGSEDTIKFLIRTIPVIIFVYTAHLSGSKLYIVNGYSISISSLLFYSAVAVAFINLPSAAFEKKKSPISWLRRLSVTFVGCMSSESGRLLAAGVGSLSAGSYLFASITGVNLTSTSKVPEFMQSDHASGLGSIQHDRVMMCFLVPIVMQLTSSESRIRTVLCQWIVATISVSISIAWAEGWQQLWTLLYSGFFLFVYYQIDRVQKNSIAVEQTLLETQTLVSCAHR